MPEMRAYDHYCITMRYNTAGGWTKVAMGFDLVFSRVV